MLKYKNLTLIGTSHIALESIKEVTKTIKEIQPQIVALELDRARFLALIEENKASKLAILKQLGIKAFLLNLIGAYIEKKLGKLVGVSPGSEMKKAALIAREQKAEIILIDQDVRITLKKLTKIPFKEKLRIFTDIIKGFITRKVEIKIDLTKVPNEKTIRMVLKKIKERYPIVYKFLIKERNEYMAKHLYKIMTKYKEERIVAVVGAGHEKSLIEEIKRYEKNKIH